MVKDQPEELVAVPKENLGQIEKTYFIFDDDIVNVKFVPLKDWKVSRIFLKNCLNPSQAMVREHTHESMECIFLDPKYVRMKILWR